MRKVKIFATAMAFSAIMAIASYAGEWKQDTSGYWYQNDDGSYTTNGWQEIDGKQYYFDGNGYMLSESITPDGKLVGTDGSVVVYNNSSYQSILDYYSLKLKYSTPVLIAEYNNEISSNNNGLMGLAEIYNNKVGKLAEILNEGIGEMAKFLYSSGSGQYSEYEEWCSKLYDVYMEEGGKIGDAYMASAR